MRLADDSAERQTCVPQEAKAQLEANARGWAALTSASDSGPSHCPWRMTFSIRPAMGKKIIGSCVAKMNKPHAGQNHSVTVNPLQVEVRSRPIAGCRRRNPGAPCRNSLRPDPANRANRRIMREIERDAEAIASQDRFLAQAMSFAEALTAIYIQVRFPYLRPYGHKWVEHVHTVYKIHTLRRRFFPRSSSPAAPAGSPTA